jgi:hypothetical protein
MLSSSPQYKPILIYCTYLIYFFSGLHNNNGSDGTDDKDDEDADERRACERARVRTPKTKKLTNL